MRDIVFIRQLKVDTVTGVYDWEREIKQTLVFNLEMAADIRPAGVSDRVEDALDYSAVATRIKDVVENSQYQLLEALAEKLVTTLQQEFNLSWLRLRVSKPGAVADAEDVGLLVERGLR